MCVCVCVYIYIYMPKKILFTKLTQFDHLNKNIEHYDLKIIKILVQQK